MPPEYVPTLRSAASVEADPLEQLVAAVARSACGSAVERGLQPQVLAPGEQRVERRLLQRGADRASAPAGLRLTTS